MFKNFLIMGTQRTGSTVLYRTLNFHPKIACGAEWVLRTPWWKKLRTAESLLNGDLSTLAAWQLEMISPNITPNTEWMGFKVLFRSTDKWVFHPSFGPALWLDRFSSFLSWVASRSDIHVIHIQRNDDIDWLKSKYLASSTGRYVAKPYPDRVKVEIPIRRALRRLRAKDWIDSRIATLADTNPYLRISYEEFVDERWATIERLMGFLDSDINLISSIDYKKLKKQSRGSPSDYIENFSELAEAVSSRFVGAE